MALNSSGPISLAGATTGQSIALELGQSATGQISLNDTAVRGLAGVASGAITMPTNFWGKSNVYTIANSLRFRSSASAYLNKRPATAGNLYKWTISFWHKRGQLGYTGGQDIINAYNGPTSNTEIRFNSSNQLQWIYTSTGTALLTTQVFRDPSAWYHFVFVFDSQNATASNRAKIYVNGVEITSFATDNRASMSGNVSGWNNAVEQYIMTGNGAYVDGYLAEFNNIDGQALTPSSFGETNASTGVWQPKAYSGSYGTNGFYQKYSSIATTSGSNTGLGQDFSGNGNYFNTLNISVTSGETYDAMIDSPTPVSATVGNYAVWNPLVNTSSRNTFNNGNLQVEATTQPNYQSVSTFGMSSGKWYCELSWNSGNSGRSVVFGITNNPMSSFNYWTGESDANSWTYYSFNGNKANNGSSSGYGSSYTIGDIIGIAFDADTGALTFYKNNVSQGTAFTGLTSGPYFVMGANSSGNADGWFGNFGQRPFTYTPPTGFNRMQTYNLPTPTIGATSSTLAGKYFNPVLYTGNGSTQTVSGVGFQPDLVWIKERSSNSSNWLTNAVTGVTKRLSSNETASEATSSNYLTAFTSNGFTVGSDVAMNENGQTYVAWNWKANGAGSSNTAGSITSTVSANTTAGFSVVTYTGNGSSGATVGHGLGVAPKMIIIKNRSASEYWYVYNQTVYSGTNYYLWLNDTSAARATNATARMPIAPTSSVFSVGSLAETNGSTNNMLAYCFSEVAGYSKFGGYTGNGSTDGPFVYTGFRPAFVLIKSSSNATDWNLFDSVRGRINPNTPVLRPNSNGAEFTADSSSFAMPDFLSNGFKLRSNSGEGNASGWTYIYMAFAESPFNYSLAR